MDLCWMDLMIKEPQKKKKKQAQAQKWQGKAESNYGKHDGASSEVDSIYYVLERIQRESLEHHSDINSLMLYFFPNRLYFYINLKRDGPTIIFMQGFERQH